MPDDEEFKREVAYVEGILFALRELEKKHNKKSTVPKIVPKK